MRKVKFLVVLCITFMCIISPLSAEEVLNVSSDDAVEEKELNTPTFDDQEQEQENDNEDLEKDDLEYEDIENNEDTESSLDENKENSYEDDENDLKVIDDSLTNDENEDTNAIYNTKSADVLSVNYRTHVSDIGWMSYLKDGAVSGKLGANNKVEAINIQLGSTQYSGKVNYQTHVQNIGWQSIVSNNALAGTTGKCLNVEAIKISLDGELAEKYNIFYRVYVMGKGYLDWTSNGAAAGSEGYNKAIQGIEIKVLSKDDSSIINGGNAFYQVPLVKYQTHVENIGWQPLKQNGAIGGTTGKALQLEALKVMLPEQLQGSGQLRYQAHVENIGWQGWTNEGAVAGTSGRALQMEALQIELTNENSNIYDIYYRVHIEEFGWLGWAKNGQIAGSVGCNRRIEAIEIKMMHKNFSTIASGNSQIYSPKQTIKSPVYYNQHDGNWAFKMYGKWNMSNTGCVPTSIAMAFQSILNKTVKPTDVANYLWSNTNEFNKQTAGCSGLAIQYAANHYKVKWKGLTNNQQINEALMNGDTVIALVGPGNWIGYGYTHAIVLHQYSKGKTYVYDPNTSSRNGWYATSTIWNQKSNDSFDLRGGYVFYALSK